MAMLAATMATPHRASSRTNPLSGAVRRSFLRAASTTVKKYPEALHQQVAAAGDNAGDDGPNFDGILKSEDQPSIHLALGRANFPTRTLLLTGIVQLSKDSASGLTTTEGGGTAMEGVTSGEEGEAGADKQLAPQQTQAAPAPRTQGITDLAHIVSQIPTALTIGTGTGVSRHNTTGQPLANPAGPARWPSGGGAPNPHHRGSESE